jgi:predicted methyltransferase
MALLRRAGVIGLLAASACVLASPSQSTTAESTPSAQSAPAAQGKPKNRLFSAAVLGLIEPPDRNQWQPPELIMDDLSIADGAVVADLGAGGGWFTIQLARRVGPNGVVYAEDVQSQMIDAIRRRAQRENLLNVRTIIGTADDPKLPHGIDAALIVDTYHEMACGMRPSCREPVALLTHVARALKPQGRLGVLDFYPGQGGPGPAPSDRVDPETVIRAAAAAGLQLVARKTVPPFQFQYLLVFGRAPNTGGLK